MFEDADFERLPGDLEPYQAYGDSFQAEGSGGLVFQDISQRAEGSGRQRVELWFGPNFGGVAVSYRQVRGYTRGSTAEQTFHRNGNTATHGPMRSSTSTNPKFRDL